MDSLRRSNGPMTTDLACPRCHGELESGPDATRCTECGSTYPIALGIVDFVGSTRGRPSATAYNRAFVVETLYRTAADLETRVRLFNTRLRHDAGAGIRADVLNLQSRSVLEVGCGTMEPLLAVGNRYRGEQAVWGIDISLPLLLRARENAPRVSLARADAARLPFRDGSFDLVWARHMLYHTEWPEAVVREGRRCLGRAGVFAVSTNSARNKPEMHSFHRRLMRMHGLEGVGAKRGSERFPAENAAAILRQYFDHVLDVPYTGRFRFADAGEFLEYYASTTNFKLAVGTGGISRESLLASAGEILREHPLRSMSNDGTLVFASRSPDRIRALCNGEDTPGKAGSRSSGDTVMQSTGSRG